MNNLNASDHKKVQTKCSKRMISSKLHIEKNNIEVNKI